MYPSGDFCARYRGERDFERVVPISQTQKITRSIPVKVVTSLLTNYPSSVVTFTVDCPWGELVPPFP